MKLQSQKYLLILGSLFLLGLAFALHYYFQPRSFADFVQEGELAYQDQNLADAVKYYIKALKVQPTHTKAPEILMRIGDIHHYSRNDLNQADKSYQMLVEKYPQSPQALEALKRRAEMYQKAEKYPQARKAYQRLLTNFPQSSLAEQWRYEAALLALKNNEYDLARQEFKTIIEKNEATPLADQILYQISNSFFLQEDIPQAREFLEVALAKYPQSELKIEMQFLLANIYERQAKFKEAIAVYESLLNTYPNPQLIKKKLEKLSEFSVQQEKVNGLGQSSSKIPVARDERIPTRDAKRRLRQKKLENQAAPN